MYGLEGQTALITGGSTGIGRAIAARLAEEGCDIGILDINEAGARETVAAVEGKGRRAVFATADVGDSAQVAEGMATLIAALGQVDVLVNSAGILRIGAVVDLSDEDWRACQRVNADGVFYSCRAVAPHMIARGKGRIINIASWTGKKAMPNYSTYAASKFAVIGLTQALALEVAEHGVTANAICPGSIMETGMRDYSEARHQELQLPSAKDRAAAIPMGRLGLPDDIARMAAFLASAEATYMTGQAINVTGGLWMN